MIRTSVSIRWSLLSQFGNQLKTTELFMMRLVKMLRAIKNGNESNSDSVVLRLEEIKQYIKFSCNILRNRPDIEL